MEGSGGGLIWGTTVAFTFREWRVPRKDSVRIASHWVEISVQNLPNKRQQCYGLPVAEESWNLFSKMWTVMLRTQR
jgi:hypothetical protein